MTVHQFFCILHLYIGYRVKQFIIVGDGIHFKKGAYGPEILMPPTTDAWHNLLEEGRNWLLIN